MVAIYTALAKSVLARGATALWPGEAMALYGVSAVLWGAAFAGYAAVYDPLLLRRQPDKGK
jgi:uncharacterized protein involved in response to NO